MGPKQRYASTIKAWPVEEHLAQGGIGVGPPPDDRGEESPGRLDSVYAQRLTAFSLQPKHLVVTTDEGLIEQYAAAFHERQTR